MHKMQHKIPRALQMMINIAHKLTIGSESNMISTNKYASSIFHATACASLFLRLLCPALIAPLDWGALRQPTEVDSKTRDRILKSMDSVSNSIGERRPYKLQTQSSVSSIGSNRDTFSAPRMVKTKSFFASDRYTISEGDKSTVNKELYYEGAMIIFSYIIHNALLEMSNQNDNNNKINVINNPLMRDEQFHSMIDEVIKVATMDLVYNL
jgi:hypothetical protein